MTEPARPTRVMIVEDHLVVGDALATMLGFQSDIEVVGRTRSGTEAVQLAGELRPDVVLLDIRLEGLNGIEATRRIKNSHPEVRVVVLSMHDAPDMVARAVAVGADGFLPKTASGDEVLSAVRRVASGEAVLHPSVTGPFLRRVAVSPDTTIRDQWLTEREQEVLEHLAEGKSTKEIADALFLGEETVKTHLGRIYQKLGVSDRVQAVAAAIRGGLVP
jgi:DNA-binding NarL/FixJ family response regulator